MHVTVNPGDHLTIISDRGHTLHRLVEKDGGISIALHAGRDCTVPPSPVVSNDDWADCPFDGCGVSTPHADALLSHMEEDHGSQLPWRSTPDVDDDSLRHWAINQLLLAPDHGAISREQRDRIYAAWANAHSVDVDQVRVLGLTRKEVDEMLGSQLLDWQWVVLRQLYDHHAS